MPRRGREVAQARRFLCHARASRSVGHSCAPFHFVGGFHVLSCCSDIENLDNVDLLLLFISLCCVPQMLRSINFLGTSLPQLLRVLRRFTRLIPTAFDMVGEIRYLKSLYLGLVNFGVLNDHSCWIRDED